MRCQRLRISPRGGGGDLWAYFQGGAHLHNQGQGSRRDATKAHSRSSVASPHTWTNPPRSQFNELEHPLDCFECATSCRQWKWTLVASSTEEDSRCTLRFNIKTKKEERDWSTNQWFDRLLLFHQNNKRDCIVHPYLLQTALEKYNGRPTKRSKCVATVTATRIIHGCCFRVSRGLGDNEQINPIQWNYSTPVSGAQLPRHPSHNRCAWPKLAKLWRECQPKMDITRGAYAD